MKKKNGFTFVEVLAVVVLLGVLATVAMTTVLPQISKSKKEIFLVDAKNIMKMAEGLFAEKQALNELPRTYSSPSVEGIYYRYKYELYGQKSYIAYAIDIQDLKSLMDIEEDYTGYVILADYGNEVKSYINLTNNNFELIGKDDCIKNGSISINMCFYSTETLKEDFVINNDGDPSVRQVNFNEITSTNKNNIRLY